MKISLRSSGNYNKCKCVDYEKPIAKDISKLVSNIRSCTDMHPLSRSYVLFRLSHLDFPATARIERHENPKNGGRRNGGKRNALPFGQGNGSKNVHATRPTISDLGEFRSLFNNYFEYQRTFEIIRIFIEFD